MSLITRDITPQEKAILDSMASDASVGLKTSMRARAVVSYLNSRSLEKASIASKLTAPTIKKILKMFDAGGWQALIVVQAPRGGDFLARYDQGYWAERLTKNYCDESLHFRAIPYGTSRSEPFTDLQSFRKYAINEALLQAWSAGKRWKRPDLLMIPRKFLEETGGTDEWTPDLLHWDNERCKDYILNASIAIEVETSLWQVKRATISLSFTVKEEDLPLLKNWVTAHSRSPLFIVQVFYDQAYALPFQTLENLIGVATPKRERILPIVDRFTEKATYSIPLSKGVLLGDMSEPDVEGRIYKADNGRVTVYGRLTGSKITVQDRDVLEKLVANKLL